MELFTIGAMYDYSPEIFDGISDSVTAELDGRVESISPEDVICAILYRCEMFKTVRNSPHELRKDIARWWKLRKPIFSRMLKTTMFDYNPIHNYDRTETWKNTQKKSGNGTGTIGGNVTEQKRGFDENMTDSGKTVNSANTTTTYTDNGELNHTASISGNIGVTTTQDLLNAEREIVFYNVLENIAQDFKENICICVY